MPGEAALLRACFPSRKSGEQHRPGRSRLNPDPDNVYRRVRLLSFFDNKVLPSPALGAVLAAAPESPLQIVGGDLRVGDHRVPWMTRETRFSTSAGPSGTHKTYSAASVIQSELRIREWGAAHDIRARIRSRTLRFFWLLRPRPVRSASHPLVRRLSRSGDLCRPCSTTCFPTTSCGPFRMRFLSAHPVDRPSGRVGQRLPSPASPRASRSMSFLSLHRSSFA